MNFDTYVDAFDKFLFRLASICVSMKPYFKAYSFVSTNNKLKFKL